jgi:hypothetical protein
LDRIPAAKQPRATPIRIIRPQHVTTANNITEFERGARFIGCSILEWTKESRIVIVRGEYEDHQNVRDRIDNTTTIEKYAREAQLWPHEEMFGEDQVLRNVKFYVTDGSFTVKTTGARDIITSEQTLQDAGEGAGGIMIMPCNPTDQVLCLHIKSDEPQPGINAYTWELLAAAVGLHTMKFMPSAVKGFSDCMSAIIRLNEAILAFHNTQSNVTAGILISGGYQFRAEK